MSHITTQRVRHQGKVYLPGDSIELTKEQADALGLAVKTAEKPQESKTEAPKPTRRAASKKPTANKTEGE